MSKSREIVKQSKRVVVKVGSTLLTSSSMRTPMGAFLKIAKEVNIIREKGKAVSLVSSGAIAQGLRIKGYDKTPVGMSKIQALAALGQPALMNAWERAFAPTPVAQYLISKNDITNPTSFFNIRRVLRELEKDDIVAIGNENDTVATDEIRIGDNDTLAANVSILCSADLLIILTQVDGLYTSNPDNNPSANLIKTISHDELDYARKCSEGNSSGFESKLQAVQIAFGYNIPVVIANGNIRNVLPRLMEGEEIGTLFIPMHTDRSKLITDYWPVSGSVVVRHNLLDIFRNGIWMRDLISVKGSFSRGNCVEVVNENGLVLGRGFVAYTSLEIELLRSRTEEEVISVLGIKQYDHHILHPDDYISY